MAAFLKNPINLVWGVLAFLTGIAWFMGDQVAAEDAGRTAAVLLVMSFFKVRLVILHFMEARIAPWGLRLIVEAYVLGVCAVVLLMYFRPPSFN